MTMDVYRHKLRKQNREAAEKVGRVFFSKHNWDTKIATSYKSILTICHRNIYLSLLPILGADLKIIMLGSNCKMGAIDLENRKSTQVN